MSLNKENYTYKSEHTLNKIQDKSTTMLVNGKFNSAKVFASVIDDESINQIKLLCDQLSFKDSLIRMMPDVHAGAGCVIGTTMTIKDKVVPNLVGVDIGCGMYVVNMGKLNLSEKDLEDLDRFIHEHIPAGFNVNENEDEKVHFDLEQLRMYKHLKNIDRLQSSIGTLGG